MPVQSYSDNVFLNCPLDQSYKEMFDAIIFTIYDCGFVARCSLEEDASGDVRFSKIENIVGECRYGIHDISRTELDVSNNLPRFNMPLELGLFFGARKFGNKDQRTKKLLILDVDQYRYQQFISDLAGYDIKAHNHLPEQASGAVRDWLVTASRRTTIPDRGVIWNDYRDFQERLPSWCRQRRLQRENLVFIEYSYAITDLLVEIEGESP